MAGRLAWWRYGQTLTGASRCWCAAVRCCRRYCQRRDGSLTGGICHWSRRVRAVRRREPDARRRLRRNRRPNSGTQPERYNRSSRTSDTGWNHHTESDRANQRCDTFQRVARDVRRNPACLPSAVGNITAFSDALNGNTEAIEQSCRPIANSGDPTTDDDTDPDAGSEFNARR